MHIAQKTLFPEIAPLAEMPTTRYQGSKRKLLKELHEVFSRLDFLSCLDAFGGTGSVTHLLRFMGKHTHYNDILPANTMVAKALFANKDISIDPALIKNLFVRRENRTYHGYISDTYKGIFFTDEENHQLDTVVQNILRINDEVARAEAYYCLFQAALSKRPYNLFHRANLQMRLNEVQRNFGNKATWDRPFLDHMLKFQKELAEYKKFTSRHHTEVSCQDAFEITGAYDLVYIDTPYAKSDKRQETNYFNFYHFLDAILDYANIAHRVCGNYAHRPIYEPTTPWHKKKNIEEAFQGLFHHFKDSVLVISYRSDGYPSPEDLISYLKKWYAKVDLQYLSNYKYVLSSKKTDTKELVIIAS